MSSLLKFSLLSAAAAATLALAGCGGGGASSSAAPPAAVQPSPGVPAGSAPASDATSEPPAEGPPEVEPAPETPATPPSAPQPTPPAESLPPTTPPITPTPAPAAVVNRTVLGVLVSTPTRRNQRSVQELRDALFSSRSPSVRSFYWITSGGRLNVTTRELVPPGTAIDTGDVIEVTIPDPVGTECTGDAWGKAARVEALKLGYDQKAYDTTFYISPKVADCSNAVGSVGTVGKPNHGYRVVYFDKTDTPASEPLRLRTLAHEMGHNIGLGHARTITCLDDAGRRVSMSANCTEDVQGDPTDAMGTSGRVSNPGPEGNDYSPMDPNPRLLAASRAYDLGWLTPSELQVVTGPGVYRLRPLYCSADNGAPRALRLASTTPGRDYWLETRIACGGPYDNFRNGSIHHGVSDTTVNGLIIRQGDSGPGPSGSTFLLDLHPATTNGSSGFVDAALSRGEVFSDPLPGGLRFEITAVDADGTITVRIR